MDLNKINRFPYILDEWDRLVKENPEWKFVYSGVATQGRRRIEVDDVASRVYAHLKKNGIGKEDFVMICLPRSSQIVPAILGVLKAGAAFTIVDRQYSEERINYIYQDCGCKYTIDLESWPEMMQEESLQGYEPTDDHDACFAVYTSGSTGNPKGVVHEYGKLKLMQITAIEPYAKAWKEGGCRFALIPPLNFVAALKFIIHGIYTGMRIFIVPTETIKNPRKLRQYFQAYKITDAHMAPSVIRAAGDEFGPHLKRVVTGSEPPNGITVKGADLINNYTMTESAFVVAQYKMEEKSESVPIGKPNYDEVKIHLLDENGNEVPDGEEGEICFENPYFREYRNLPEETERALRGGLFHTEDLGKKLEDGNYAIVGRMNDMIKINGNRVEPAEIERCSKEILGIEVCVAKGFVDVDKAFLCLYYDEDIEFDVIDVKEKFGAVLPYYMVPTYYIKLDKIPRLPNGKVDKKALPKPDTSSYHADYVKPRNELEAKICEGIQEILKIERVGIRDDFFELGGDSLTTMELLEYLDWEELSSTDIYNGITAERIAAIYTQRISASSMMSPEEYEMKARMVPHRLTPTQIFMLDSSLYKPNNNTWNLPTMFRIDDVENVPRLAYAVNEVIRNTPICSTMIYVDKDSDLRQRYMPEQCPTVQIEHVTDAEMEEIQTHFDVRTNVVDSFLYQFRIFQTETCGYLFINRHHIATDGMAKNLLYQRIADAYEGKPLTLDTYYTSIQRWEESLDLDSFESDEKYFMERYGDVDWTRGMDPDYDRKDIETNIALTPVTATQEEVSAFEKNTGVTRNQLFNLGMMLAIAKCSGKEDIMMHYTFHNRRDHASNKAIGGLYTVLPLAIRLGVYRNVAEMFDDVKSQVIGNAQHGDHNWSDLLIPGELHEDFSVTYETNLILGSGGLLQPIGLTEVALPHDTSLVSINRFVAMVLDTDTAFNMVAIYMSNVYSPETAQKYMKVYDAFLSELVSIKEPAEVSIEDLMDRIDLAKFEAEEPAVQEDASVMSIMGDANKEK